MVELFAARKTPSKVADVTSDTAGGVRGRSCENQKPPMLVQLLRRAISLAVLCTFGATGLVAVGLAVAWMVPGLLDSAKQRTLHRAPVHADHTTLNTHVVRAFAAPKTLIYRDRNGILHQALVDQTDLDRFVNETLDYLDVERVSIKAETQARVDALLATAFSDGQDCIAHYADWYFE